MSNIKPCLEDIRIFSHVVFGGSSGLIPCRSFQEKGSNKIITPRNIWVKANDDMAINIYEFAIMADKAGSGCYVIPATVINRGHAKAKDIKQMQTLLIDIDDGDTEEKLQILTKSIGKPTLIVESGGITKEGNAKLHIYWQLRKKVTGNNLKKLLELRHKIAIFARGDTHFKSAHQPIRVAGSVYHKKGACRLAQIRSYEPLEYDLEELIGAANKLPSGTDTGVLPLKTDSVLQAITKSLPFEKIITSKVYENAEGEQTRFNHLQRVTGFWLRRCHDGTISKDQALEEISAYNQANVKPPWPEDRLSQMINGLQKKHIKENGETKAWLQKTKPNNPVATIISHSLGSLLGDNNELPRDIIAPRILTPGGIFVFGGAPKVGKSDFLLSLFTHMAAGKEFLGFKPSKPLKIFYFQAEIGYHYLRERLQNMNLSKEITALAKDNLYITPNTKLTLNEAGIQAVIKHLKELFEGTPDIIAVDPIRNVFDGGREGATENDNDAMLFFLQRRIEVLRDEVNPDAGIILVHHTKKLTQKQFDEEPFAAFSGASSLRGYYSSGGILRKSEIAPEERELIFELRNGAELPTKILSKENGEWFEENPLNRPVSNQVRAIKLNAERDRREQLILDILKGEAAKGRAYTMGAFCEAFDGCNGLGSNSSIRDRLKVLARKGYIKFFKNTDKYGFEKCTSKYGLMCFQGMQTTDKDGEIHLILPTHYRHHELDKVLPLENPHIWVVYNGESL